MEPIRIYQTVSLGIPGPLRLTCPFVELWDRTEAFNLEDEALSSIVDRAVGGIVLGRVFSIVLRSPVCTGG